MKTRMPSYHSFCLGLCFFPLLKWPSGWIVKYETRIIIIHILANEQKMKKKKTHTHTPNLECMMNQKTKTTTEIKNEKRSLDSKRWHWAHAYNIHVSIEKATPNRQGRVQITFRNRF